MPKGKEPSKQMGFLYPISGASTAEYKAPQRGPHNPTDEGTNMTSRANVDREQRSREFLLDQLARSGILDSKK